MKRNTILLPALIMIITIDSYAQKKGGHPLQWQVVAELPAKNGSPALGVAGPVAGVHHSKLLIGGGANFPDSMPWQGGVKKYYDDVYVYLQKDGKPVLHHQQFKLPYPLAYAASCSGSIGIVFAGGENENGILDKVMLLQWDEKNKNIVVRKLPALPVALTNAAATVINDVVYVAGGENAGSVSDQFIRLDLNNLDKGWQSLPPLPKPLSHAILLAQVAPGAECIFLAGGRRKNANGISNLFNSFYKFDFKNNKWEIKQDLPYVLSAGTGIVTPGGQVLLFGGDKGDTFLQTEKLIAQINSEGDNIKKKELIIRKNKLQSAHPGFSREILRYDPAGDKWIKTGCIPFETPVTTTAVLWNGNVVLPSGEIKAGVRTPRLIMAGISE